MTRDETVAGEEAVIDVADRDTTVCDGEDTILDEAACHCGGGSMDDADSSTADPEALEDALKALENAAGSEDEYDDAAPTRTIPLDVIDRCGGDEIDRPGGDLETRESLREAEPVVDGRAGLAADEEEDALARRLLAQRTQSAIGAETWTYEVCRMLALQPKEPRAPRPASSPLEVVGLGADGGPVAALESTSATAVVWWPDHPITSGRVKLLSALFAGVAVAVVCALVTNPNDRGGESESLAKELVLFPSLTANVHGRDFQIAIGPRPIVSPIPMEAALLAPEHPALAANEPGDAVSGPPDARPAPPASPRPALPSAARGENRANLTPGLPADSTGATPP